MDREQMLSLGQHILSLTSSASAALALTHTATTTTRFSRGQVQTSDDGNVISVIMQTRLGERSVFVQTNQLDDEVMRQLVQWCEAITRVQTDAPEPLQGVQHEVQDTYIPVKLWHDTTVDAMQTSRASLLPQLLQPVTRSGLHASGFVGLMAQSQAQVSTEGVKAYYEETDCEVTVSARTADNTSSGWAGQAARDWTQIDPARLTSQAIDLALRGVNPKAVEPGRWTVILTCEAVAQMFRYFAEFYDGFMTEYGVTPMTKSRGVSKIGEQIFDSRISMKVDPADPDGGFAPFFKIFPGVGYANPALTLAERGVLKDLTYYWLDGAMGHGKPYSEDADGLRVSGGPTSLDQMIASCPLGIYVNRFSHVDLVDLKSGLLTGVTQDGCFLVKDGKIAMPVKNFRFEESPMFMLNKLLALGESKRAAYGYTPAGIGEDHWPPLTWPRRPIIVPSMMVRDFEFTSLADAV